MKYLDGSQSVYIPGLADRTTVAEFFSKTVTCNNIDEPVLVILPISFYGSPKIYKMFEWCKSHLTHDFDYAFLGAIEDNDGEWFLNIVPESSPTAMFFAFGDADDALMFHLTWKGETRQLFFCIFW